MFRRKKRLYLVFEFVDHTVLDDLERCPNGLDTESVRKVLWQTLKGIEFCHLHNVRDCLIIMFQSWCIIEGLRLFFSKKYFTKSCMLSDYSPRHKTRKHFDQQKRSGKAVRLRFCTNSRPTWRSIHRLCCDTMVPRT